MMQKFRTKPCFVVTDTLRMLGIVNAVLVIGVLISAAGVVLLTNLAGAGDYVIRHLTSRSLGTLPPGFAASRPGFQVYALLVVGIGLVFLGLGTAATAVTAGVILIGVGLAGFAVASVLAIRGEVTTARDKRL
jgi:hypothetical protein